MKLNELVKNYGEYEVENGFMDFLKAPKPKTVWDLQKGDIYYCLNVDGAIECLMWEGNNADYSRRGNRRCFLTEEDAIFAREQDRIFAEMERLGGTKDMMSLDDKKLKYCIRYLHDREKLDVLGLYFINYSSSIFFKSKEDAMNAIKEIGEDRIKKYLFYVKESETK